MRVKRLEIQGFKSFKDKMVIQFDHSITGIVGPNGCGKSNIVDAFFWVMGEQSYKHMRGNSSDDLIFNGSSRYSPLGMAEATLVLETEELNADAAPAGAVADGETLLTRKKEVSVTRRIYRGGEGEYFINGMPARLKDIHELFLDTGVGTKGYSIIEQGQIGKIVNSKPEERRTLIEDAAGIAKYKARKKESLRKMESAEQNLARLHDVIAEIERSLNSLERQAQKAQQYKKFKEELFDKEMTWGRRKVLVLRQKIAEISETKETLDQEVLGLKTRIQTSELNTEQDRLAQLELNRSIEDLNAKIQDYAEELTQTRSQLELSRQRRSDLDRQISAFDQERATLEAALSGDQNAIKNLEEEAEGLGEVFETAVAIAAEMAEKVGELRYSVDETRKNLESAQRELIQIVDRSSKMEARAASLQSRIESANEQKVRVNEAALEKKTQLEQTSQDRIQAQERLVGVEGQREEQQNQKNLFQNQIREKETELSAAEQLYRAASKQMTQVQSRMQSLEELEKAYEGYGDASKSILEWAQSNQGAVCAFADAFRVKRGMEKAAEGWFEKALEDILTEDAVVALTAFEQIENSKQGRARIHMTHKNLSKSAPKLDVARSAAQTAGVEFVGLMSECVEFSGELSEQILETAQTVLKQVVVVSDLKSLVNHSEALAIALESQFGFVDLQGFALEPNGVLRGGSLSQEESASVLGRKRLIAELRDQLNFISQEVLTHESDVNELKEVLEGLKDALSLNQETLQSLEIEMNLAKRDLSQFEKSIRETESLMARETAELERIDGEISRSMSELNTIQQERTENQNRIQELEMLIQEREASLREREEELRSQQAVLEEKKMSEAALRERSSSVKRELDSGLQRITERSRRLEEVVRSLERAKSDHAAFEGADSGLNERSEELTMVLSKTREDMAGFRDQLEQVNSRLNDEHESTKLLQRRVEDAVQSVTQAAIESEKLSSDLNHLVLNLEEKYGAGCLEKPVTSPIQEEMQEPVVTAEMTAEEEQVLFEEVERLKDRIRRLGEVNVMAIEEYEELKKRYDHLLGERGDLERSILNLKEAIEHINKTSEQRFLNAFHAIAERFERLFPIIFGGGSAKLSLIYPEGSTDVLDAGVDILAQPPGKKVSNITLLSGGEKALTALSMVFAIFMVKPSPFCVLDEVDAPLDDTNIGKFNALLREMSVRSQFIIVTHNKKTMELNDSLYGVTMEEPGVSKMISIELH